MTVARSDSSAWLWQQQQNALLGERPAWEQRKAILELVGHRPTPGQEIIHAGLNHRLIEVTRKLVKGGFQSGKSMFTAAEIFSWLLWINPDNPIWVIGPDYRQARKEFEYLVEFCKRAGIFNPNAATMPQSDASWRMTLLTGHTVETYSAVNLSKIAGSTPGFVAMVEAGQQPVGAFQIASARAALKDVPLIISGTVEDPTGWYVKLADKWSRGNSENGVSYKLPTWTNTTMFSGKDDPKIVAFRNDPTTSEEFFKARYEGEYTAPPGLVFGKTPYHPGFDENLHVRAIRMPYPGYDPDADPMREVALVLPPNTPLELWIDPGWDHAYAVLIVAITEITGIKTVCVLDEIYERGALDQTIIEIARGRWWWPRIVRAILDPHGSKQHHPTSPHTSYDYWMADPPLGAGIKDLWADETVYIDEGTKKIRALMEVNPRSGLARLLIDPRCENLQWEMREGYRNKVDSEGNSLGKPRDINNDAIKALHYGVHVAFPGLVGQMQVRSLPLRRTLPWEDEEVG